MNRKQRTAIAEETLAIVDRGEYAAPSGTCVSIKNLLATAVAGSRVVSPEQWPAIIDEAMGMAALDATGKVEATAETTLAAAGRMHAMDNRPDLLALSFASAKNPGGGFLSGAQAQEESLARASGLYSTLLACQAYYAANRATHSKLYTDHAIFSPHVPVFRSDDGMLLETPYKLTFHTAPAPNVGAIEPESPERELVDTTFCNRMTQLFALAATTGHRRLVLGAWGCGVFRNDPARVAELFAATLFAHGWSRHFAHICFAIYDHSEETATFKAFQRVLEPHITKELP